MIIPIHITLEVVRDGCGELDTRQIDMMLGFRGLSIDHGILSDLRQLESVGLIEEVVGAIGGTGPRWRLTEAGARWLTDARENS